MARRWTAVDSLRGLYPDLLLVDGGDVGLTSRPSVVWQIPLLYEAMASMGYDIVAIGERDADSTTFSWIDKHGKGKPAFLGGNLARAKDKTGQVAIFERGGFKIGIAAAVSENVIMRNPYFAAEPLEAYLQAVSKQLESEGADFKVLLFHGDIYQARKLARTWRQFDVIFVGHSNGRPMGSEFYANSVPVVGPGDRGRELAVVTLRKAEDGQTKVQCDILPLDDSVRSSSKADPWIKKNKEIATELARRSAKTGNK